MPDAYISFCEEELWRPWKEHRLSVPTPFDPEAAPEPYLYFGDRFNQLVVLTTNPGATMNHQRRAEVQRGLDPLSYKDTYDEAAPKLGDFYETHLAGPARHRIDKMRRLSSSLRYEGVLQVEGCPFHSRSMPQKSAFLQKIAKDELLGQYVAHLRVFLRDRPVVSPQAVSTQTSLERETPKFSQWLTWIAEIAGFDLDGAEFVRLVEKGPKTTVAAWVSQREPRKALVLRMGAPGLPADESLCKLAAALRAGIGAVEH